MNQSPNFNLHSDENFDFKKEFFKYLYFWKFFLGSCLFFLVTAFLYTRYTPKVFYATAKIKIIDKKEASFELPSASELFSNSKINLENEIEIVKSYPIFRQVIENKKLYTSSS